ncbi:MAG: hypothetical protein ABIJ81_00665 [Patescibacteria group bacterium]|nr:hypothetical protein [Candidatus Micrarchaeota archaeon]
MKEKQFITKEYLDEKFKEQAQVIVVAVDGVLDKRLEKTEENLKKEINNVQTLIDAYVKTQEDFKQEFTIIKEEMNRVKEILKEKLGVEVNV